MITTQTDTTNTNTVVALAQAGNWGQAGLAVGARLASLGQANWKDSVRDWILVGCLYWKKILYTTVCLSDGRSVSLSVTNEFFVYQEAKFLEHIKEHFEQHFEEHLKENMKNFK